jgi:tyrosine-protein phosphatase SIW14
MTRSSLLLALVACLLVAGFPFVYARQRHETYRNFRVVDDGVLYRSGQMSAAGMARVCREKGIKTVISLRDEDKQSDDVDDEEAVCRRAGVQVYETISPKGWEEENGVVPMEANLKRFADRLDEISTDPQTKEPRPTYPRPILIHCFAGIHRTGSHVAVYRVKYDNYTPAEAVAELKSCGKPTTTYVGNLIPFLELKHLPTVYEQTHGKPAPDGR